MPERRYLHHKRPIQRSINRLHLRSNGCSDAPMFGFIAFDMLCTLTFPAATHADRLSLQLMYQQGAGNTHAQSHTQF